MSVEEVLILLGAVVVILSVFYTVVSLWGWVRQSRRNRLPYVLREFFGRDPRQIPIVHRTFNTVDLPNLHLAITDYVASAGASARLLGYVAVGFDNSLRELIGHDSAFSGVTLGPVQYREVDIDVDSRMQCVEHGIHLISSPAGKIAAHVYLNAMHGKLEFEIMAATQDESAAFMVDVRKKTIQHNVYRRKIISLECNAEQWGGRACENIRFHAFPALRREEIILPEATRNLIERNTLRFFQQADALRRSGRSLKRGLLLHGKPGTGKTHTAKWLARSLEGVTVILLSGEQLWLIKECCQMARALAPTLVIMEDVDLIATARSQSRPSTYHVTLHQLLNEMDGLASDAEVIFLLTTNRPEAIEPALASRPGRIDQAIEFPLPDAGCRRRLIELYGRGLTLELADMDRLIVKSEGASPAFIQELMRKAALIAAEDNSATDGTICVTDTHCDAALSELVGDGGNLTRNLLGFDANGKD